MHPTPEEQLEGIARLVERVADRHPEDPSAGRLRTAAGTLRRIGSSWSEMLPFLRWDNEATAELLVELLPDAPAETAARLRRLDDNPEDPLSARDAHERNKALRGLLAHVIDALPPEARTPRAAIAAHLRERIARDPYTARRRE